MSEHWDFWHVSNISRDFEGDWARAFFLPAGVWAPVSAFRRVWALLPNHKRPWTGKEWIRGPFVKKPGESTLSLLEKDQLLEITDDSGLKSLWGNFKFLYVLDKSQGRISRDCHKNTKSLLPFPTSYLCEAGFSAVTATKMKLQSRPDISNTLCVSLSPITAGWDLLVAGKPAQGSHWFCIMVSCIIISLYITM